MDDSTLPTFPEFKWNGYFWVTSAKHDAWSGYQIRNGLYGDASDDGGSDGTIQIVFGPEGRAKGVPLTAHEIELVKWLVDHQAAVHDAAIGKLFEEYPGIREEALEWYDSEEATRILPKVNSREQLKDLVKANSIYVHIIERDSKPFIGIGLGCSWDDEHGVGILLHGDKPLEIGGADTAFLLWKAKKYMGETS